MATTARGGNEGDPFRDFLERMYDSAADSREAPLRGIGTGFFIRSDGIIATNFHVVEGATDVAVQVGEEVQGPPRCQSVGAARLLRLQLAATGRVVRGYMGVSIQESMSAELAESFGVPAGNGVLITEVVEDGPGWKAGIRPGDIVTSFNGEPVAESYRLRWLTANAPPGSQVKLGVWRGGKLREMVATLNEKTSGPRQPQPAAPTGPAFERAT